MTTAPNFDRLARCYRLLEFAAFGRSLERARFALLHELASARSILVLGEGDGRCLARLAALAPLARIHCIDASAAMVSAARARLPDADGGRVDFTVADVRSVDLPAKRYDAVVTLFFLDCFTSEELPALAPRIVQALQPAARWLYADFAEPASSLARWRARAWLAMLYTFFRWQTGLRVRRLPDAEALLQRHGFVVRKAQEFQAGMLRAVLFDAPAIEASAAAPAPAHRAR